MSRRRRLNQFPLIRGKARPAGYPYSLHFQFEMLRLAQIFPREYATTHLFRSSPLSESILNTFPRPSHALQLGARRENFAAATLESTRKTLPLAESVEITLQIPGIPRRGMISHRRLCYYTMGHSASLFLISAKGRERYR